MNRLQDRVIQCSTLSMTEAEAEWVRMEKWHVKYTGINVIVREIRSVRQLYQFFSNWT